jgi:hypothetical protein
MDLQSLKNEYNFDLVIDYKNKAETYEQDECFSEQFLHVFYLDKYHEKISDVIEKLFICVKDDEHMKRWIDKVNQCNNMMKPDDCGMELMGFMMLFTFDHLQHIHECLQSLFKNGMITENNIKEMDNLLK